MTNKALGLAADEAKRLGGMLSEPTHGLAMKLAMLDSYLPNTQRTIPSDTTRADMLTSAQSEALLYDSTENELFSLANKYAWNAMGDELAQLVEDVPIILISSRQTNASIYKNRNGAFAILLESDLVHILHYLITSFCGVAYKHEFYPTSKYEQRDFAETIAWLAAYRATGEHRFLSNPKTLNVAFDPNRSKLTFTSTATLLGFIILHEYGHLLGGELGVFKDRLSHFSSAKSLEEKEFAADYFAMHAIASLKQKSIGSLSLNFVRIYFHFEMLAYAFAESRNVQLIGPHPRPDLRLMKLDELDIIESEKRFHREADLYFQKIFNYSNFSKPSFLDGRRVTRNCEECERPVIDHANHTNKMVIMTEDLVLSGGKECRRCERFWCLRDCATQSDLKRTCPKCGELLVTVLPLSDPGIALASRDPEKQVCAAATTVYTYIEREAFLAARIAYQYIWDFHSTNLSARVANEIAKLAVTLIDVMEGEFEWSNPSLLQDHITRLYKKHPNDHELAIRFSESCLNLCGRAIKDGDNGEFFANLEDLIRHHKDWLTDVLISNHLLNAIGNGCFLASDDFERRYKLGKKAVLLRYSTYGKYTRTAMVNAGCVLLREIFEHRTQEKALEFLDDLTWFALNWGDVSFRDSYARGVDALAHVLGEDNFGGHQAVLKQIRKVAKIHPETSILEVLLRLAFVSGWNSCTIDDTDLSQICYDDFRVFDPGGHDEIKQMRGMLGYQLVAALTRKNAKESAAILDRELDSYLDDSMLSSKYRKMVESMHANRKGVTK